MVKSPLGDPRVPLAPISAVIYRSDDLSLVLPNRVLPNAVSNQPVEGKWLRVFVNN